MNCLKYLLQKKLQRHNFKILYNGDHCIGVNMLNIYDYNNQFKNDLLLNTKLNSNYLPIEEYHTKEDLIILFNLNEEEAQML